MEHVCFSTPLVSIDKRSRPFALAKWAEQTGHALGRANRACKYGSSLTLHHVDEYLKRNLLHAMDVN